MSDSEVLQIPPDLWPIANFYFQNIGSPVQAAGVLYITIFFLAVVVYKIGFAKKLPLLKSMVVYLMLLIGCIFLTVPLGITLPVAEGLFISAVVLIIYKIRLQQSKKEDHQA